jgi:hypothetical protein
VKGNCCVDEKHRQCTKSAAAKRFLDRWRGVRGKNHPHKFACLKT